MSEPVSAFAAYRASGMIKPKQKNKDSKKNNTKKNANGGGGDGVAGGSKGPRSNKAISNNSPKNKKNNKNNLNNSTSSNTSQDSNNEDGVGDIMEAKSPKKKARSNANGNGSGDVSKALGKDKKGNRSSKAMAKANNFESNDSIANDNSSNGNKNGKGLNKNAGKVKEAKGQKKSVQNKKSNTKTNAEEDSDGFTANELKLLASKPSDLTEEERIRRAEIESKYLAYKDDDEEDNDADEANNSDVSGESDSEASFNEEEGEEEEEQEKQQLDEEGDDFSENEEVATSSNALNRKKNAKGLNKNAVKVKGGKKSIQEDNKNESNDTIDNTGNSAIANSDEDPDVFTAEEVILLASKPSALSEEERIRRADIESHYLKYIDDDNVNVNENEDENENDEIAAGNTLNGKKSAKRLKNAGKVKESNKALDNNGANTKATAEEEPDDFTSEELILLASNPESLSKEERIRRAEIESNCLKYIDNDQELEREQNDDNDDNDDDGDNDGSASEESSDEETNTDASLTGEEEEDDEEGEEAGGERNEEDDDDIIENVNDNDKEELDINSAEEETSDESYIAPDDIESCSDSFNSSDDYSEYSINSFSGDDSIQEEVLDDLVLVGQDENEQYRNPTTEAVATRSPAQKRKSEAILKTPQPKQAKTSRASPSPKTGNTVKQVISNVKLEPLSPPVMSPKFNSIEDGKKVLQWLINPFKIDDFFKKYWETSPCLIKRTQKDYFKHLISFEKIGEMLLKNHIEFTKNIDITKYKNGKRETLNPEGRALPPIVWEFYQKGCSVRLLNPQSFIPQIYSVCTRLQEFFACFVGVNAYLTPAGTQGFAPHYDDIEAFVVQVEGQKRWRLYQHRQPSEILPRYSSGNFKQSEIGEPIFEQVLQPGDVLYFPRGVIHQAVTEEGHHSLHLTFSVYQKNSYADLFEKLMPLMVDKAINNCVDFRKGLPLTLWRNNGIAYSDTESEERVKFQDHIRKMLKKMITSLPMEQLIDQAVDQVAKKFQYEALPPEILHHEKHRTIFGSENCKDDSGAWVPDYDINIRTNVRLLRANILRLVEEEDKLRIYYHLDNAKEYFENQSNFIEIARREAGCVEVLIRSYPEYVGVAQLPLRNKERKIGVVRALWERGLLMMEKRFK